MDRVEMQARYEFWKTSLEKLRKAYLALIDGGVKSYTIDDRQLTKFDLPALKQEIKEAETQVDELSSCLKNGKPRKAFGVVMRDW